jgi:hypothetical protein
MTVYTAVADSDIDPESAGTTTLFTRLRDNPIAITEGASGAPAIQTAALEQTASSEAVTTATIRDLAVTAAKIAAGAVTGSKIGTAIGSTGTQLISSGTTWTIPAGLYNISNSGTGYAQLEINVSASWRRTGNADSEIHGLVWSDGTNMRVYANNTVTIYWQKWG